MNSMFGRSRDEYTAGTSCGDERQRGLAEIRQAVQPVGLAANHLQGPGLITWHVLDHLLSLVHTANHIGMSRAQQVLGHPDGRRPGGDEPGISA